MVIIRKGNWQKSTLADKAIQLNTIYQKALVYKTLLGISTGEIDRIKGANLMCQYISTARSSIVSWDKSLTKYDEQLLDGNILEMMNPFPATPVLDIPPAAGYAGIWHYIENRRKVWMMHPSFTEGIGEDMTLIGPDESFDTDTYKPSLKLKAGAGVIHVKTGTSDIDFHNLFAGIAGKPLVFITSFKGAKLEYNRVLAVVGQAENVNIQLQGVYQNIPIGKLSDVVNIAYNG